AERNPGTMVRLGCRSRISLRSIRATKEKRKRNAGRRVVQPPRHTGAARAKRRALACRRSTTALAAATKRHRSAPVTRFLGRNSVGAGVTRSLPPQCSGLPRRPVIVPAGRFYPEPPGSGGDEPPPAGTALAPSAGVAG